jgi:hypothetical protein
MFRRPTYRGIPKGAAQIDGFLEDWLGFFEAEIGTHGGTQTHGTKSGNRHLGAAEWE